MAKRWLFRQYGTLKRTRGTKELIVCFILITFMFLVSIVILDSSTHIIFSKGHHHHHQLELNHQTQDNSLGTSYHYVTHGSWMGSSGGGGGGSPSSASSLPSPSIGDGPSETSSFNFLLRRGNIVSYINDRLSSSASSLLSSSDSSPSSSSSSSVSLLSPSFWSSSSLSSFHLIKPNTYSNTLSQVQVANLDDSTSNSIHGLQAIESKIYQLLSKLNKEIKSRHSANNKTRIAILRGGSVATLKEMSIYKWALRKHGFLIEKDSSSRSPSKMQNDSTWNLLICLDYSDDSSDNSGLSWKFKSNSKSNSKSKQSSYQVAVGDNNNKNKNNNNKMVYHRIDGIPGLKGLLGTKESFCSTIREIHKLSTLRNPFLPLCFNLPHQYQTFLDVSEALGHSASWSVYSSAIAGSGGGQPINIFTDEGRNRLRDYASQQSSGIIVRTIDNPLTLFGSTLTIRLFLAITSINPLRTYIHQCGLVYFTSSSSSTSTLNGTKKAHKSSDKFNGRYWTLDTFWDYMTINYGPSNVSYAQTSMKSHLTQFLLVTEALLLGQMSSSSSSQSSSSSSFNHYTSSSLSDNTNNNNNNKMSPLFDSMVSLLAIDITLNSSLDSWILGVSMGSQVSRNVHSQSSNHENNALFNKLLRTIYDDYLTLIVPTSNSINSLESNSVQQQQQPESNEAGLVKEVHSALMSVLSQGNVGIMGLNCHITHDVCLSSSDLTYLLNWRDEVRQVDSSSASSSSSSSSLSSGFVSLYPTVESSSYLKLIEEISSKIVKSKLEKGGSIIGLGIGGGGGGRVGVGGDPRPSGGGGGGLGVGPVGNSLMVHRTWDLHEFLMQMDIVSTRLKDQQKFHPSSASSLNSVNSMRPTNGHGNGHQPSQTGQSTSSKSTIISPMVISSPCNQDESSLPLISSLEMSPLINLTPAFSPFTTQYYVNVTYDLLVLTVYGTALHCSSEVRFEGKFGPSRPTNYTLGLGINKIVLTVVDVSQAEPMVINTYTVSINRLPLPRPEIQLQGQSSKAAASTDHLYQVCYLKQDCDLPVYPRENCDLIKSSSSSSSSWFNHLKSRKSLPYCGGSSGSEPGKWSVPCLSCKQKSSCNWASSVWEPDSCQYGYFNSTQLSKCLSGRKILFIGDSTNRGLMHYLMERLNGSLVDGNKTHDLRIYDSLNQGKTLIGFNYYPKFWLPSFQRSTFDATIQQLIEKAGPLSNTSDTVLVFGGVQWLASQHINLLLQSLSSLQLNGIKVIMKTLGAGFHQKMDGIHSLSLEEQQKLALHNQRLIELAESHNIAVVDTYNMTISRYKDFYPGKCLCHFHQAIPIQETNNLGKSWTRYHIDGPINAAYGEILMHLLCHERENEKT